MRTGPFVRHLGALAVSAGGDFFMPPAGSTSAPGVDHIFDFVLGVSVFFFLLIVGLMVFFVVRYRRRPGVGPLPSPTHHTALEVTWTAIPILIVLVIFVWGFKVLLDLNTPPANAYEVIQMEGSMSEGGRITVEIREPTSTGWSERRKSHFRYTSSGVMAEPEPG